MSEIAGQFSVALVSVRLVVVKVALFGVAGSIVSATENATTDWLVPLALLTVTWIVCGPWFEIAKLWPLTQATAAPPSSLQVVVVAGPLATVKATETEVVVPGSSAPAVGEVIVTVGPGQAEVSKPVAVLIGLVLPEPSLARTVTS